MNLVICDVNCYLVCVFIVNRSRIESSHKLGIEYFLTMIIVIKLFKSFLILFEKPIEDSSFISCDVV